MLTLSYPVDLTILFDISQPKHFMLHSSIATKLPILLPSMIDITCPFGMESENALNHLQLRGTQS